MLCSIGNYNSLVIAPQLSKVAMTSDFNRRLKKNEGKSKCLFMFEDGASCFHDGKKSEKYGEGVLAHCEKHSKESVELVHLYKLLFITI